MGLLEKLGINQEMLTETDPKRLKETIIILCNLIEEQAAAITTLQEAVQALRDENAHLKGEQGKPEIHGKNKKSEDISSEKERKTIGERKKKESKRETLTVTRTEVIPVDKTILPEDAIFKGYATVLVQDIIIKAETIAFKKEVYYSPSQARTFVGEMPGYYQGAFGPQLKALVLVLKTVCTMSEPAIIAFFQGFGIQISEASIHRILTNNQEPFHIEKEDIFRAGIASTKEHHIDDTASRVNGENYYTHVVCNQWYSAYFTKERKDRLTILEILNQSPLRYLYDKEAEELFAALGISSASRGKLDHIPRDVYLSQEEMERSLILSGIPKPQQTKILEATAIIGYQKQTGMPIVQILIADDAPQFKLLTKLLALCWIHDGRHYKKLHPVIPHHREALRVFLGEYWGFYRKLVSYKMFPIKESKEILAQEFDTLFATQTTYHALNERIAKTKAKKEELLLVLSYPDIQLHNNPAELAARQQVRKRDVSLQTRTNEGTKVQDTFLTIVETAKKLNVKIYGYILDRVKGTYLLPSLADIIQEKSASYIPTAIALP